jgi:hypothetical protein
MSTFKRLARRRSNERGNVTELIKYDSACRALAAAVAVDEVKKIRDNSEAMRAYARQAKNKQLEVDAAEIRIRAERRIGELMQAQKDAGLMAKGTKGDFKGKDTSGGFVKDPPEKSITLAEVGIDKALADRARKYAAVPQDEWEEELGEWRERVTEENNRVSTRLQTRGETEIRKSAPRKECDIPDSAIVSSRMTCPTCGQSWPEGMPIHG